VGRPAVDVQSKFTIRKSKLLVTAHPDTDLNVKPQKGYAPQAFYFFLPSSEFLNKIPSPAGEGRGVWPNQVSGFGLMFSHLQFCLYAARFGLRSFGPALSADAELGSPSRLQGRLHRHHPRLESVEKASGRRLRSRPDTKKRHTSAEHGFSGCKGRRQSSPLPWDPHAVFSPSQEGVTCTWGDFIFI
jgi:hypothetical protein